MEINPDWHWPGFFETGGSLFDFNYTVGTLNGIRVDDYRQPQSPEPVPLCPRCPYTITRCICPPDEDPELFGVKQSELAFWRNDSATASLRDATISPQRQEMESSTHTGVTAVPPTISPDDIFPVPRGGIDAVTADDAMASMPPRAALPQSLFETPCSDRLLDHQQSSHLRESVEGLPQDEVAPDSADRKAADILNGWSTKPNGPAPRGSNASSDINHADLLQQVAGAMHGSSGSNEPLAVDARPREMSGFAKLDFQDGDYIVTTHDVMLGRNMGVYRTWLGERRQERRARRTLEEYRDEPSQPSQHGNEDQPMHQSSSSHSLDGRPAPPSNRSENGGIVYVHDGKADTPLKKRQSHEVGQSSSAGSINPSILHKAEYAYQAVEVGADPHSSHPGERTWAFVPIHPQNRDDIKNISREHLVFSFNFEASLWELHVRGKSAIVNNEIFERGDIVALDHGDEILCSTVQIKFKLPDDGRSSPGISHGTFDGEASARAATSSNGVSDDEEQGAKGTTGAKKKPAETKKKKAQRKESKEESPEELKKGKKPKPSDEAPPPVAPGSIFEGVPLDQMPAKRAGPGRPAKDGNASKRDQQLMAKKKKWLEERGLPVPPMNELIEVVRLESKQKAAHAKALKNGEVPPDTVLPSIERDPDSSAAKPSTGVKAEATEQADTPGELVQKETPKQHKRTAKSPSPVKPEAECTEEELKKPAGTYVHIIDEILRDHPAGLADLPDIYNRIQKRYPYYKYKQTTLGWQSSVRHNLLQNNRFKENGKSGKGKLWMIDQQVPLEKEQKKRKPSPPMNRPMNNGQYPQHQGQYGPSQYGHPYGNHQPNGQQQIANGQQGAYYSPYAQQGQPAQHAQQGVQPKRRAHTSAELEEMRPWDRMIAKLIDQQYLFKDLFDGADAEIRDKKGKFADRALNQLSEAFHAGDVEKAILPPMEEQVDMELVATLKGMFNSEEMKVAMKDLEAKVGEEKAAKLKAEEVEQQQQANGEAAVAPTPTTTLASEVAAQTVSAPPVTSNAEGNADVATAAPANTQLTPAIAGPSATTAQPQPLPSATGTKRAADDADEPQTKRARGE